MIDKLNADLGHAFTKQEDSLLFCTFISRLANDLTLKESNKVAEKKQCNTIDCAFTV